MKIKFSLGWISSARGSGKDFKSKPAAQLFEDYSARISSFHPALVTGPPTSQKQTFGSKLWICERGRNAKVLSSEEIATLLNRELNSGTRLLEIAIGGADGFKESELRDLKPDLLWSFGPLTLPHELAAVVASEQIYRALTILYHLPYHSKH